MITREKAKEIALKSVKDTMEKEGKTLDDICLLSPKTGKSSWTYREYIEAIEKDEKLEDSETNPIDLVLNYEKYLNERGKSILN